MISKKEFYASLLFLSALLLLSILVFQNRTSSDDSQKDITDVEIISVTGDGAYREIASSSSVKLELNGAGNKIKVMPKTNVIKIVVMGSDTTLYLPKTMQTSLGGRIEDGGEGTKIEYY